MKLIQSVCVCLTVILFSNFALAAEPINIGSRRELFVDQHLIEKMTDVRLVLHHPVPQEVALVHDKPLTLPL